MRHGFALACWIALGALAPSAALAAPQSQRWFRTYTEAQTGNLPAGFTAAAVQPDGKVVFAGYAYQAANFQNPDFIVVRVDPLTGAPDPSFDGDGVVRIPVDLVNGGADQANAVAVSDQGSIFVAGQAQGAAGQSFEMVVAKLTSGGQLDPVFGTRTYGFDPGSFDRALALVVDGAEQPTVAGSVGSSGNYGFGLLGLAADGSPRAFGANGRVTIPFGEAGRSDAASSLVRLGDGSFAAGGVTDFGFSTAELALAKLSPAGVVGPTRVVATPERDTDMEMARSRDRIFYLYGAYDDQSVPTARTGAVDFDLNPVAGVNGAPFRTPSLPGGVFADPGGDLLLFGIGPFPESSGDDDLLFTVAGADGNAAGPVVPVGDPQRVELPGGVVQSGGITIGSGTQIGGTVPEIPVAGATDGGPGTTPPAERAHYRVELQAWIPQAWYSDFERPEPTAWGLARLGHACMPTAILPNQFLSEASLFDGDDHAPYDGPRRARVVAEFDWNGTAMENFTLGQEFGMTRRLIEVGIRGGPGVGNYTVQCVAETGQGDRTADGGSTGPDTFRLSFSAQNPLRLREPTIDSMLNATVSGPGGAATITFTHTADWFPSHGLRVYRDNLLQLTSTFGDVSCLPTRDLRDFPGTQVVRYGLTHDDDRGTVVVPGDAGRVDSRPSRLCAPEFRSVDVYNLRGGAGSGAAPSVAVAPIDAAGRRGAYVPLSTAVARGLADSQRSGDRVTLLVRAPVALRARSSRAALIIGALGGSAPRMYTGRGDLTAVLGSAVRVTSRGRTVRGGGADTAPPRTTARVRLRGSRAVVTLRARDATGVAAIHATLGTRRLTVRRSRVTVPAARLTQLRYFSVDVFGNFEAQRRAGRSR